MKVSTFLVLLSVAAFVDASPQRGRSGQVGETLRRAMKANLKDEKGSSLRNRKLGKSSKSSKSSSSDEVPGVEAPSKAPSVAAAVDPPVLASVASVAPSEIPSDVPSDVPSEVPSQAPSDGNEVPVNGSSEFDVPTLGPSASAGPSEMPSDVPTDIPSYLPSDIPSGSPSSLDDEGRKLLDTLELFGEDPKEFEPDDSIPVDGSSQGTGAQPVGGALTFGSPSLAPSVSSQPSGGPSEEPSQSPSDGEGGRMLYDTLELFGENPDDYNTGAQPVGGALVFGPPSLAPSASPQPSGGPSEMPSDVPSDMPSGAPSDGVDGRKLGATAVTGTLVLPGDSMIDDEGAPSLAPSASPAPSDVPSLAPSQSPGPSDEPSEMPSGAPSDAVDEAEEGGYTVTISVPGVDGDGTRRMTKEIRVDGRKLGATAVTLPPDSMFDDEGTLILPGDEGAPSLAPSVSSGPSDVPSLAPSESVAPSAGPSDMPSISPPETVEGPYTVVITIPVVYGDGTRRKTQETLVH